jgi:nitroreductase
MGSKTKKKKKKRKDDAVQEEAIGQTAGMDTAPMSALEAITQRRTHKHYTARPVERAEIEAMLDAAVLAPNHKMTEPWRFVVLGDEAKRAYGGIRARAKVGVAEDGDAGDKGAAKRAKIVEECMEVPTYIALLMYQDEDAFRREEDHAAVWMAAQNMLLAATSLGLGTKIATGRVFEGEELRALVGAKKRERVLGMIHVGQPAEARKAKERTPAAKLTTWLD